LRLLELQGQLTLRKPVRLDGDRAAGRGLARIPKVEMRVTYGRAPAAQACSRIAEPCRAVREACIEKGIEWRQSLIAQHVKLQRLDRRGNIEIGIVGPHMGLNLRG